MKKITVILAMALVLLVSQGCGGGNQFKPPSDGDTLTSQQIVQ